MATSRSRRPLTGPGPEVRGPSSREVRTPRLHGLHVGLGLVPHLRFDDDPRCVED